MEQVSMKLRISSPGKRINFSAFVQHSPGRIITHSPIQANAAAKSALNIKSVQAGAAKGTKRLASRRKSRKEGNVFCAVKEQGRANTMVNGSQSRAEA